MLAIVVDVDAHVFGDDPYISILGGVSSKHPVEVMAY
jgi:hypothetical protein